MPQAIVSYFGASLLLSLMLLVGCGRSPATVTGVVSMDGQPLQRGNVGFAPVSGGMKATSRIQSDGSYELSTNRDSGLQLGDYQVTVVSREPGESKGSGPPMPGKTLIPIRYGRVKTSKLNYTVESGSNTINIELSSEGLK